MRLMLMVLPLLLIALQLPALTLAVLLHSRCVRPLEFVAVVSVVARSACRLTRLLLHSKVLPVPARRLCPLRRPCALPLPLSQPPCPLCRPAQALMHLSLRAVLAMKVSVTRVVPCAKLAWVTTC